MVNENIIILWPECSDVSHLILVDGEDEADWNNQYTQHDDDNSKHSQCCMTSTETGNMTSCIPPLRTRTESN